MKHFNLNEFDLVTLAFAIPLLFAIGCSVDLETPAGAQISGAATDLKVGIIYMNDHGSVTRTMDLELETLDMSGAPQGYQCSEDSYNETQDDIPANQLVTEYFTNLTGRCPGKWIITVTAFDNESGDSIFPTAQVTTTVDLSKQVFTTVLFTEGSSVPTGDVEPPLPTRNVLVDDFQPPPAIGQGDLVDVNVTYRNTGTSVANTVLKFKVKNDTEACNLSDTSLDGETPVTDFDPGVASHTFEWDTTGVSAGAYRLCVWLDPLAGEPAETTTDDNLSEATVTIATRNLILQNLTVLPAGQPVIVGDVRSVQLDILNNGGIDEMPIAVTLEDTPPGGGPATVVGTSTTSDLAAGGGADTVAFTWDTTVPGFVAGQHRLSARISAPVTAATSFDSFVEHHDAEVVAVTPQSTNANVGDVIPVAVTINNNGTLPGAGADNVTLDLTAQNPGGGIINIESRNVAAVPGTSVVNFNWDTSCYPAQGAYTLNATVSVPRDSDSSNDTGASAGAVNLSFLHNQLTVQITSNPGNVNIAGGAQAYEFQIINGNSVAEKGLEEVELIFSESDGGGSGYIPGTQQFIPDGPNSDSAPPFDLECGETKTNTFLWGPNTASSPGEIHILQLQIPPRLGATTPISTSNITITLQ